MDRFPLRRSRWRLAVMLLALCAGTAGCGSSQPNVLLVSVDTLRADVLGSYGGPVATPAFDALAAEGVLFQAAIAPAPETAPSHASLFTGLDVQHHGVTENGARLTDQATLAEAFREAGYTTAAFVSSFVLDPRFGLERGFEHYDASFSRAGETVKNRRGFWSKHEFEGFDRRAAATNARVLPWLEDVEEPFFLFVHYFDPHAPNVPEPELVKRVPFEYARAAAAARVRGLAYPAMQERSLRALIRGYVAEVLYTDRALAALLAALDAKGARERTLVVVTADHGEGLGQHGILDHAAHLYEEQVRVPLLIRWPGVLAAGTRVVAPVGLVDVAPSVAALTGVAFTPAADGRSFASALLAQREPEWRPLLGRRRFYPKRFHGELGVKHFVRDARWKYIRSSDEPDELYDLTTDPGEERNLHATASRVVATLSAVLDAQLRTYPFEPVSPELSPDERRALEALGYAAAETE